MVFMGEFTFDLLAFMIQGLSWSPIIYDSYLQLVEVYSLSP